MKISNGMNHHIFTIFFLSIFFVVLFFPSISRAATLLLSPANGTFSVGSTFDVSILLDTKGQSINALDVSLSFPPDMLQIVSPSTGQSIIGVWTANPKFDNINGRLELQGGIPGGITTSNALISTITFRVKSVGETVVKFLDKSKVLSNDGLGTNVLTQTLNATYKFRLPPPAGPIVISKTNPDQATWYSNKTVSLQFINEAPGVEGYSYILSDNPTTNPDDINEGKKDSVSYTNLADGIHYFHIKSLRAGIWGGTTHFAIKVDATPPADFKIDIMPSSRTSSKQPVIQFTTTDTLSGVDYYNLKFVPLSNSFSEKAEANTSQFFIEATSPYIPSFLKLGSYDVIIRAYDKSGNYREITERLLITTPLLSSISSTGIYFGSWSISWLWVWFIGLLLLVALIYTAYRVRLWRYYVHFAQKRKELPDNIVKQLEELKKYREKYGAKMLLMILVVSSMLFSADWAKAQTSQIAPPLITTISKNISNEEIFYIGGKTDFANESVIIYLQNLQTGETFSQGIKSDNKGDWFYRHTNFLSPGNYHMWVQGEIGEELSPPGPQVKMTVNRTAVQFGGGRLSYETIYLFIIILLLISILGLGMFIIFHFYHGRKKHQEFQKDIKEAEESIKRGFAVLRRDIEAELAVINKAKLNIALSTEERIKEAQLLSDLDVVQKRIGKEIWEIAKEA